MQPFHHCVDRLKTCLYKNSGHISFFVSFQAAQHPPKPSPLPQGQQKDKLFLDVRHIMVIRQFLLLLEKGCEILGKSAPKAIIGIV